MECGLRAVNLWNNGVADKQSRMYSGGMKRRLSVAISFMGDPLVVYLDEPSTVRVCGARRDDARAGVVSGRWGWYATRPAAKLPSLLLACLTCSDCAHTTAPTPPRTLLLQGLDPASRRNLWDVVKSNKAGRGIVLTTHSMEEAETLCDRLGIFVDGQLVCIGNPKEITSRRAPGRAGGVGGLRRRGGVHQPLMGMLCWQCLSQQQPPHASDASAQPPEPMTHTLTPPHTNAPPRHPGTAATW